jgi:uncharacterized protein YqfA (UPF0365 family)
VDIKVHKDKNTVIMDYFNTKILSIDRTCRQAIKKETSELNDTVAQMHLADR